MASILQMVISNSFSWKKIVVFLNQILQKFVSTGPVNSNLVKIIAWYWTNAKQTWFTDAVWSIYFKISV